MAFAPSRLLFGVPSSSTSSAVERALVAGVEPDERLGDLPVHVRDRLRDALAEERGRVAVAQLDRLVLAGRGAGGHRRAPERARLEADVDLDRRVAARVEDLPPVDVARCAVTRRSSFARSY